jgi:hypothetical protein
MKQNIKISIFAAMLLCSTAAWSQTDDTENQVMQKVTEALSQGDCDRAQRNYNVWKDLTQTTNSSVESRIKSCFDAKETATTKEDTKSNSVLQVGQNYTAIYYKQGDEYSCKGIIAYLDYSGKHGLLLRDEKRSNKTPKSWSVEAPWKVPTKEELETIYKNKIKLGLNDEYWSSTKKKCLNGDCYYTMDFYSGKVNVRDTYESNLFTGKKSHANIFRLEVFDF